MKECLANHLDEHIYLEVMWLLVLFVFWSVSNWSSMVMTPMANRFISHFKVPVISLRSKNNNFGSDRPRSAPLKWQHCRRVNYKEMVRLMMVIRFMDITIDMISVKKMNDIVEDMAITIPISNAVAIAVAVQ